MDGNENERVRDLEEYCSASNDSLSFDVLQEKLGHVSPLQTSGSHFLHELCLNKNVTLEMVELILGSNPYVAYFCSNRYHGGMNYDDEDVDAYEAARNEESEPARTPSNICSDRCYPIHLACANEHCSNAVVELLASSNPAALRHLCILKDYPVYPDCSYDVEAAPLHYYFSRSANIPIGTVQTLMRENPESLIVRGYEIKCLPIHVLIANPKVGKFSDIVQYMIESDPSSLERSDEYDQVALHLACWNKHITANVIQLLIDGWPRSTQQRDCNGSLPIHHLCENKELDEQVKLDVLRVLVGVDPESLKGKNQSYHLPIHISATRQSPAFVKLLIDAYPNSLRLGDEDGNLPFHMACEGGNIDTVKYLHGAYPESAFAQTDYGFYPLHCAMRITGENQIEVAKFLLRLDPDSPLKPVPVAKPTYVGCVPLHIACMHVMSELSVIQLLFDAHPAAIYSKALIWNDRSDPLGYATIFRHAEATRFLRRQLDDVSTLASAGDTPIHYYQWSEITSGAMKLILDKNPHVLFANDPDGNSPLHHACRGGKLDIVNQLLRVTTASVSSQNSDGKLPFELLVEADCQEDSSEQCLDYIEATWRLLVAHPETVCPSAYSYCPTQVKTAVKV